MSGSTAIGIGGLVHKKRTHFASKVHHVGATLERRGVAATYDIHDRVLTNPAARRRLAHHKPVLDETQQRIVRELREEGFSLLSFADLFPDPADWAAVEASAARFIEDCEQGLEREARGEAAPELRRRVGKEFVLRRYSWGVKLGFDDIWLRLAANRRMIDIANVYHGLLSKLEYVDLWYTPPVSEKNARRVSQNWHRDFNDRMLLKAFIYLVDVDDGTGPFEHIPGTEPGGVYSDRWPWRPNGVVYPPVDEFERWAENVPRRTFTGPKGTMLFCNTAGFHRGGFATEHARVLATFTYDSPAALKSLSERNYTFSGQNGRSLDEVTRYALT